MSRVLTMKVLDISVDSDVLNNCDFIRPTRNGNK